jgi:phosphomevalonate kinase
VAQGKIGSGFDVAAAVYGEYIGCQDALVVLVIVMRCKPW